MLEYFQDEAGEWRYRVKGGNGEPMATSEGYTTRASAERGFEDLRAVIAKLPTRTRTIGVKQPHGE